MILFEGIDCTGKTTAALAARGLLPGWSYRYQSEPTPIGGPLLQYEVVLADSHPRLLLDRLYLSEYAYGLAHRGECRMGLGDWRLTELMLMCRGCSVVWMWDDLESVRARWNAAREMYDFELMWQVQRMYATVFGENGSGGADCPAGRVNIERRCGLPWASYRLPELLEALPELAVMWEARAREAALLPVPSVGIGSVRPEFVVVGDELEEGLPAAGRVFAEVDVPFGRGRMAARFWVAADELGLDWRRGWYTNAASWEGREEEFGSLMTRFSRKRGGIKVVALGPRAAELVCKVQQDGDMKGCDLAGARIGSGGPEFVKRLRFALGQWCDQLPMNFKFWGDGDNKV